MENMMIILMYIGIYFMPVLCITFCVNLVSILKKIKNSEDTSFNTFWMTSSFTLMMWSIAMLGFAGAY